MDMPIRAAVALCVAFACSGAPSVAYAMPSLQDPSAASASGDSKIVNSVLMQHAVDAKTAEAAAAAAEAAAKQASNLAVDKMLVYDPALIKAIGTQESTGHTICCCEFACAYGDAVIDGTVNDHAYYGCGNCLWPDWGGGDSSYRSVGETDDDVLREAYDQIADGKPTVIHVVGTGEHWISLIGYTGVTDPNDLTLDNFVALDPWDGMQVIAGSRYTLYGDNCEHISERSPKYLDPII